MRSTTTRAAATPALPLLLAVVLCATSVSCSSGPAHVSAEESSPTSDSEFPSIDCGPGALRDHRGRFGSERTGPRCPGQFVGDRYESGPRQRLSAHRRIVVRNPAAEGHVANFGVDGSDVNSLLDQAAKAADVRPKPELVLIQSIDNDIQCDHTDLQNYGRSGRS